jgi:hypothetical protein
MAIRKGDRRLFEFVDDAIPHVSALTLQSEAAIVCDAVVRMLEELKKELGEKIDESREQTVEEARADVRLEAAEARACDGYDDVYTTLRISHLRARLAGTATSDTHMQKLNLFLEGNNPSDFESATVEAKQGYLKRALTFRAQFLDGQVDPAIVADVEAARDELDDAHRDWVTEIEESAEVQAELDAFVAQARTNYRICREWTKGCLLSIGREDEISRLIRPLREIYGSYDAPQTEDVAPVEPEVADEPA